jgi:ubiquinone/menaquinone biosynthesis C-methylase UbiE
MKLNAFETLLMNNPVRSLLQRKYEAPKLAELAGVSFEAGNALVLGCGRGVDVELAFELFGAQTVTAFDLDERQVQRARKRLGKRYGDRLTLRVGDASAELFEPSSFDLAIDFGIIHHIPKWREAVKQVARVLKPGGHFLFEEVPKHKLDTLRYRVLTDHPREDRFEAEDFAASCEENGLRVEGRLDRFFGFFRGVATLPE